jgi:hypothetical protein
MRCICCLGALLCTYACIYVCHAMCMWLCHTINNMEENYGKKHMYVRACICMSSCVNERIHVYITYICINAHYPPKSHSMRSYEHTFVHRYKNWKTRQIQSTQGIGEGKAHRLAMKAWYCLPAQERQKKDSSWQHRNIAKCITTHCVKQKTISTTPLEIHLQLE